MGLERTKKLNGERGFALVKLLIVIAFIVGAVEAFASDYGKTGSKPTSGRKEKCHPAYPTVCIPPPPPDLDCKDIPYRRFPVDHRYGDPHNFDGDGDGIGCEL